MAAGKATTRGWLSPRLGQEAVTQPPPPAGKPGAVTVQRRLLQGALQTRSSKPSLSFLPALETILLPVSGVGKLRPSPCPVGALQGRVAGGTLARFTEGKRRLVCQVQADRGGAGRLGHVLTPHRPGASLFLRVRDRERRPGCHDWRRARVRAPLPSSSAGFSGLRAPFPECLAASGLFWSPRQRGHGSSFCFPRHPGSPSARLRILGFCARANGKRCLPSGTCSPKPGAPGEPSLRGPIGRGRRSVHLGT